MRNIMKSAFGGKKKILLILAGLFLIVGFNVSSAKAANKPTDLLGMIQDLQDDVAELFTRVGILEDTEDKALWAYDVNGTKLGLYSDTQSTTGYFVVFHEGVQRFVWIDYDDGAYGYVHPSIVLYDGANCSGNPFGGPDNYGSHYARTFWGMNVIKSADGFRYYTYDNTAPDESFDQESYLGSGGCVNQANPDQTAHPLEEVDLGWSGTVALPLHYRYE